MIKDDKRKYGAKIRSCDCKHEYQDALYGKQMRVACLCKEGKESRCTVCGKTV